MATVPYSTESSSSSPTTQWKMYQYEETPSLTWIFVTAQSDAI